MNYLEFAQHLRLAFQFRMRPFKFNIYAYGVTEADASSHTGRPFAFAIQAYTGKLIVDAGDKQARATNVKNITAIITDEWNAVVGSAKWVDIKDINSIGKFELNLVNGETTFFDLDIDSFNTVNIDVLSKATVSLMAAIEAYTEMICTMEVQAVELVPFSFTIDNIGQMLIDIAAHQGNSVDMKAPMVADVTIDANAGDGYNVSTRMTGYEQFIIAFQRWREALLSDYEDILLENLETRTLSDMEYIVLQ